MARRLKSGQDDTPPVRLTDEQMLAKLEEITGLKKLLDDARDDQREANGRYRAAIREAKESGMSSEAITHALRECDKDVDERITHYDRVGQYLRLMGAPLGTQFDMFRDTNVTPMPKRGRKRKAEAANGEDASETSVH